MGLFKSDAVLVLTNENKDALAEWLDEKIKLKGIAEAVDGWVLKIMINLLDQFLLSRIPVEPIHGDIDVRQKINDLIPIIVEEDLDGGIALTAGVLADLIPTPVVDGTELEETVYEKVLELIASFIFKPEEGEEGEGEVTE